MQLSKNTNEILKCKMTPDGESITCAFFQFFDTNILRFQKCATGCVRTYPREK